MAPPERMDPMDLAIKLDAERRVELRAVAEKVERCLQDDLKLQHKADLMLTEQRLLKERVEHGISKTISKMSDKLDLFMGEWGVKKEQDKGRDRRIDAIERNNSWVFRGVLLVVLVYLTITAIRNFGVH